MVPIEDYMQNSREIRRNHLRLNEKCSEIGGNSSVEFKALLAYFLRTTIPSKGQGRKAMVCHACNNPKCSNVLHLYWGNTSDNILDSKQAGTWKSMHQRTLEKYGVDGMKQIAAKAGKNSGKSKKKNSPNYEQFRYAFDVDMSKRGWVGIVSKTLNCSTTQVYRIARNLSLLS